MALTRIKTTNGVFEGKEPDTIVRREYGQKARIWWNSDPNNPDRGLIVLPTNNGNIVLDRLISIY